MHAIGRHDFKKIINFFILFSGHNDATDLSLGDLINRMKHQEKIGVKFSSVRSVQRFRLGVVFNKLR